MGDEDDARAAVAKQLDCRERGPDPSVVRNAAALERHVEVGSQQDPAAVYLGVLTLALPNEREPGPLGTYGGRLQHLSASSTQRFE